MAVELNSSSLTYTLICVIGRGTMNLNITLEITDTFRAQLQFCSFISFFSCLPAALLNIFVIIAIAKTSELHTPSNILIFSLSVTDFILAGISLPMHGLYLYKESKMQDACIFGYITYQVSAPLTVISVASVSLIALERYLALFSPYFYNHHVTKRKIVIGVSVVWIVVILIYLISFGIGSRMPSAAFSGVVTTLGLTWNAFVYAKIFKLVRRLRRRIHVESVPACIKKEYDSVSQRPADNRLNTFTAVIVAVIFFSYMPFMAVKIVKGLYRVDNNVYHLLNTYSRLILLLNSLVNPIIYMFQNPLIRRAVTGLIFKCRPND